MILLAIGVFAIILGIIIQKYGNDAVGIVITVFASIITVAVIFAFLIVHSDTYALIDEMNRTRAIVEEARAHGVDIINSPIRVDVEAHNQWLRQTQRENRSIFFDDFIPDEVDSVMPII